MAWWWVLLACVELGWVLAVGLLLRDTDPPPARPGASAGPLPEWARGTLVWAWFLYHLPLLLLDALALGAGTLLKGKGAWLVVQAAVLGAVTVAAYGAVLTWLLG